VIPSATLAADANPESKEDTMAAPLRDASLTLGIQRIEPVDLNDPMVLASLEQARRALSNPRLMEILEVRTAVQQFLCNELVKRGYLHPPIYMLAGCTDPLNHWCTAPGSLDKSSHYAAGSRACSRRA